MKDNTAVPIDSPGRRAAAYWFADGLPEIAFGLALLLLGAWGITWVELHWRNGWMMAGFLVAELLLLVLYLKHRRILDALKARITYPRTGYVRPPADFPNKNNYLDKILTLGTAPQIDENISSFRGHTVVLLLSGFMFVEFLEPRWSLPLVMTALAAGIYLWNRNDVRPYSWRAVLPMVLAGFLAAGPDSTPKARGFLSLVIGGAWLLGIGTWTLVRYLRAHPGSDIGREGRP